MEGKQTLEQLASKYGVNEKTIRRDALRGLAKALRGTPQNGSPRARMLPFHPTFCPTDPNLSLKGCPGRYMKEPPASGEEGAAFLMLSTGEGPAVRGLRVRLPRCTRFPRGRLSGGS